MAQGTRTFEQVAAIFGIALVLSGCAQPGPSGRTETNPNDSSEPVVQQFVHDFSLTAGMAMQSTAGGTIYGLVLNEDNCAFMGTRDGDGQFHVISGNGTLTWNNPSARMSLLLVAENLGRQEETPRTGSPVVFAFANVNVTFNYPMDLMARMDNGTTLMQEATLHVEFDYVGNTEVWARENACWF